MSAALDHLPDRPLTPDDLAVAEAVRGVRDVHTMATVHGGEVVGILVRTEEDAAVLLYHPREGWERVWGGEWPDEPHRATMAAVEASTAIRERRRAVLGAPLGTEEA